MKTVKPFSGGHYHRNQKRCKANDLPCAVCGKPIKNHDRATFRLICCGEFQAEGTWSDHETHADNMGGYPLGPDCAKKVLKIEKEPV